MTPERPASAAWYPTPRGTLRPPDAQCQGHKRREELAALGENIILLVNLAWTAWLYAKFLRHRGSFADLEKWQIAYLPVYAVWAALVVVLFPPVFGYR